MGSAFFSAGLDNHSVIDGIQDGRVKSMYVFGEEKSMVDSNANYVGGGGSRC
jgi:formate dehydrogenase major subunit